MISVFVNPLYYFYKLGNIRQGLVDFLTCAKSQAAAQAQLRHVVAAAALELGVIRNAQVKTNPEVEKH